MHIALLGLLAFQVTPIPGMGRVLNRMLPREYVADASGHALTPDGTRLVYRAFGPDYLVMELFSVPVSLGVTPTRLCDTFPVGGSVENPDDFLVSPDSQWVVYRADQSINDRFELFSVPVDGTGPVRKISGNLPASTSIARVAGRGLDVRLSASTNRAVYRLEGGESRLWSAPLDASSPPQVLSLSETVADYHISPDGTRVIYYATPPTPFQYQIYSIPIDGSAPRVALNPALTAFGSVSVPESFPISPDSSRVVFVANPVPPALELFSAPIDGSSAAIRLTPGGMTGRVSEFAFAPGSMRVVYKADQEVANKIELYGVPCDASAVPVKLNAPLVAQGDVNEFRLSPDGQRVAYSADAEQDGRIELYGSRVDGSGPVVKLNSPLAPGSSASFLDEEYDSITMAGFIAFNAPGFLYSTRLDGSSTPHPLASVIGLTGDFVPTQDGNRAILFTDEYVLVTLDGSAPDTPIFTPGDHEFARNLYTSGDLAFFGVEAALGEANVIRASLVGAPDLTPVHPPMTLLPTGTNTGDFKLSPDGEWVVYTADEVVPNQADLYSVRSSGAGGSVRLESALPVITAFTYLISSDSRRVVFRKGGLRSVPIDGRDAGVVLSATANSFLLTPDGAHVVYVADDDADGARELRRRDIDGAGAPIVLHEFSTSLSGTYITPDSSMVLFLQSTGSQLELHGVPADGSGPAMLLSGSMVTGGSVSFGSVRLSSDSQWAVYRADARINEKYEVFGVRVDGSAGPILLSAPMIAAGDVEDSDDLILTPDGSRVVYRADQDQDGYFDLYSVPIDGSAAAVRVNAPRLPGEFIIGNGTFQVSPDSQHVVYVLGPRWDFHSVPIGGASTSTNLSNLPGLVDNESGQFSPDGLHFLFLAKGHLYSRRIDGSAPSVRLDEIEGSFVSVSLFSFSSDGGLVAFRAQSSQRFVEDLYVVPVKGAQAPRMVSAPVPFGASGLYHSAGFEFHPTTDRIVYESQELMPQVSSLLVRFLVREPRRL